MYFSSFFRKNFFVELGAEVEKAYRAAFIDFQQAFLEGSNNFSDQGNLLAKLNRMRHLTGIAKVLPVTEFVEEFCGYQSSFERSSHSGESLVFAAQRVSDSF